MTYGLRDTPIFTFINKDREVRDHIEVLDEIETVLDIMRASDLADLGKAFKGIMTYTDTIHVFKQGQASVVPDDIQINGSIHRKRLSCSAKSWWKKSKKRLNWFAASHEFDLQEYLDGKLTPSSSGQHWRTSVCAKCSTTLSSGRCHRYRSTDLGEVALDSDKFTGFVFKIQANMDPKHRDRIAFMRICRVPQQGHEDEACPYRQGCKDCRCSDLPCG